jgi:23S rRNA (cytosine1962-C5)-methyltransferase
MSDFEQRLKKNWKHLSRWADRQGLTAFRVYDLDIPEWPLAVDWYGGHAFIAEYPRRKQRREGTLEAARDEVLRATAAVLELPPERLHTRTHSPQPWGQAQYGRVGAQGEVVLVKEAGLTLECNLSDYLDTGLFLDHRTTRQRVGQEAAGRRVLNLFSYTGAFTVHAAAGGAASTTSVDLSPAYCAWAERNLAHNGLGGDRRRHQVLAADVLVWLESASATSASARATKPFDLAVVDPPTFSASRKMGRRFEVQRDHRHLVERVLELIAPGGTLYFSTNYLGFELDPRLEPAEELTPRSIPEDFRRTVHRCWRFEVA